eukprot:274589-Prymnesium_polylepis.1
MAVAVAVMAAVAAAASELAAGELAAVVTEEAAAAGVVGMRAEPELRGSDCGNQRQQHVPLAAGPPRPKTPCGQTQSVIYERLLVRLCRGVLSVASLQSRSGAPVRPLHHLV